MPRLTSKRNGRWTVVPFSGKRRPIGLNPLYNVFRVFDRIGFGKDNGRNSW